MLSIMHKREASRLQQSGLLLREIAKRLGCSFEHVCLYLYGGIDDWEPRIGAADTTPHTEGNDDARHSDSGAAHGGPVGAGDGSAGGGNPQDRPAGGERAAAQGAEPDARPIGAAAPAGHSAQRQEAVPPVDPPRSAPPSQVAQPAASPAAAAARPAVAGDIRLTNGAGDYLDRSGVGMTRLLGKAWRGTQQQAREIKKRRPQYRELEEEVVE